MVVLGGASRYEWTHEIAKAKSFKYRGESYKRSRRVSITFRTVSNV